ncbi:MAG: RNase adapter RapZ [Bryobacteraceae bacterium]|nr:RNase adapter RapZ [Bryobacterales bacterium]NUN02884.1 RNase adapter RapZ [Bryobacteraceae bacterium]
MARKAKVSKKEKAPQLAIITGLSGSGKGTVLKALEDLGYYAVDNLPVELIPKFAELVSDSSNIRSAALVVDVREGDALRQFPATYAKIRKKVNVTTLFLDADNDVLIRRFSETRRPHPLGVDTSVMSSLEAERAMLQPIRSLADHVINTSKFTVHELRRTIHEKFQDASEGSKIMVYVNSFGFRHGVPPDSDLVFDVRFLPNPNYVPEFKALSGRHPRVARYIRSFPQTVEFIDRISELLIYLLPHYIQEGKSYLTIAFGCTGGRHRSVMIAEEIRKRLLRAGYKAKGTHRDVLVS